MVDELKTIDPAVRLQRFTPEVSALHARVRAALSRIEAARIWPASAEALRFSAQVGTIHYSTLLEGNRLSVLEAQRAVRGSLDAKTNAELELVNYVDALNFLDRQREADGLDFTEELFLEVHRELTKDLGTPDGRFKPHHEGTWRDGEALVVDPVTQIAVHSGCRQEEVRPRMIGLIEWVKRVESNETEWPVHVVAGILHHNITDIHPFADGNGRTARLLTSALLLRHDQIPGRMFNFDAFYGLDRQAYLDALRSFQNGHGSHEIWMRYFLEGMATEYERVLGEVDRLSHIGSTRGGERVQLKDSQQRGLTALAVSGKSDFNRREYEHAAGIKHTAANNDLRYLADAGVLDRVGGGATRRYRFSSEAIANPWSLEIPRRVWTDDHIEQELRELIGETEVFPSIKDFKDQGKWNLYSAIQRYGGPESWATKVGVARSRKEPT